MKKIEVIVQPQKVSEIYRALLDAGLRNIMFLEGKRIGTQKWVEGVYRGVRFRQDSVPTVKMEVVVPDHLAATAIATIIKTDSTVCADDGDVLISSVETPSLVRSETKNHVA